MKDFSAFYEMKCINKMDESCLQQYKKILEFYAPKLPDRIELDGSAFTPHDANHCLDLYRIISSCLLENDIAYDPEHGLSKRELYILNLAVLFHDIGMSNRLGTSRGMHSKESAEYVQSEYDVSRSHLRAETDLSPNEIKALKAIIKAHSNVKDPTIKKENNGIFAKELTKTYTDHFSKPIRSLFLAGILRLADELDITSERIGNGIIENQIEEGKAELKKFELEGNKEELKKWEGFIESEKHWKRLHLFETVKLNDKKTVIELVIDDDYVETLIDQGSTEKAVADEISAVYRKVKNEFSEIKKIAFSEARLKAYIPIEEIKVASENESLQKEIDKAQSIMSLSAIQNKEEESVSLEEKNVENFSIPLVIDAELEKMLTEEVRERQLLQFGHYLLTDEYCARDWLDIRELVETRDISKKIVSTIVKHINSREMEKITILGFDMVGALLASRVAFALQLPMSYIISAKNTDCNSVQDIDFKVEANEKVIIITESTVTFKTLDDTIKKYGLEDKVEAIYTVFYRESDIESEQKEKYVRKTYSMNNAFPIEIVKKEQCIYQKNKCFAKNKH